MLLEIRTLEQRKPNLPCNLLLHNIEVLMRKNVFHIGKKRHLLLNLIRTNISTIKDREILTI